MKISDIFKVMDGWSIKQQMLTALVGTSIFSCVAVAIALTYIASHALQVGVESKLMALSESKGAQIQSEIVNLKGGLEGLSQAKFLQDALVAFESVAYGTGMDLTADAALADSEYFKGINAKFSETFDDALKAAPYDSYAIILNTGSVVAEVGGTSWVGKNLLNGTWKSSNLAKCYQSIKAGGTRFEDLSVGPTGSPAAFVCTAVLSRYDRDGYKKNAVMGVLIAQIKWDFFNKLSTFEAGLGETGEIFLARADNGAIRTMPRLQKAIWKLDELATNKHVEHVVGKDSKSFGLVRQVPNYASLSSYSIETPLKLDDQTQWILVTQMSVAEAVAVVRSMRIWSMAMVLLSIFLTVIVGWIFSSRLAGMFMGTSTKLSDANGSVVSVASGVSTIAGSVRTGAQSQAAAVHETSTALEEMTAMVKKTEELSVSSTEKSSRSKEEAEQGLSKVNSLMEAIERVDQASAKTFEQVGQTTASFQEILTLFNEVNAKTQIINDVAFQTKLLSFNAAVESARAGEHGAGFAVVADEVGKLAVSVSSAASEINEMLAESVTKIQGLIESTREGLQVATDETKKQVEESRKIGGECHQAFETLLSRVREISEDMQQIATASSEQSTGISEINTAVINISNGNDANVKHVDEIFNLSAKLNIVVEGLSGANSDMNALVYGAAAKTMGATSNQGSGKI